MKECFISLIIILLFCHKLISADMQIISFNIGGYKTDFSIQTIEQFGGGYLRALLKFNPNNNNIFIDRPKEEAKLVAYFIRTQELPEKFDRVIATNAAEFFQIEDMRAYIDEHKPLMELSLLRDNGPRRNYCPKCTDEIIFDGCFSAIMHLINNHGAKIEASYRYPMNSNTWESKWGFLYWIPKT